MRAARELGAGVYRQGAPRYSSGPSFVRACKLGAGVYRHAAPPVLVAPEFADPMQTRGGSVPGVDAYRSQAVLRKLAFRLRDESQEPYHVPLELAPPERWGNE